MKWLRDDMIQFRPLVAGYVLRFATVLVGVQMKASFEKPNHIQALNVIQRWERRYSPDQGVERAS